MARIVLAYDRIRRNKKTDSKNLPRKYWRTAYTVEPPYNAHAYNENVFITHCSGTYRKYLVISVQHTFSVANSKWLVPWQVLKWSTTVYISRSWAPRKPAISMILRIDGRTDGQTEIEIRERIYITSRSTHRIQTNGIRFYLTYLLSPVISM